MPEPLVEFAIRRDDRDLFNQLRSLYAEVEGYPKIPQWQMFNLLSEKVLRPWVEDLNVKLKARHSG